MSGYHYDRRRLDFRDIVIALSHPYNQELCIPNTNNFRLRQLILSELHIRKETRIDLQEVAKQYNVSLNELIKAAKTSPLYGDIDKYEEIPEGIKNKKTGEIVYRARRVGILNGTIFSTTYKNYNNDFITIDVRESWNFTKGLFISICNRLFKEKEPGAMIYKIFHPDGKEREHWLDPNDLDFLIGVGIRALIEKCWEQNIQLVGIAKDSSSKYFTRNLMGLLRYVIQDPDLIKLDVGKLPWTDRAYFEFISNIDDKINSPWSTVEFDSALMTLWMTLTQENKPKLGCVQDYIVAHTNLFARSLSQFFISRKKATTLMGHVIFIDRLLSIQWDRNFNKIDLSEETLRNKEIISPSLGNLQSLLYTSNSELNIGQDIIMYLLSSLTRNHFPEVIGYPEPLHKADWGAKTLGDQLRGMIRSSEIVFASKPLSKTLRNIRDSVKRR